MFSISVFKFIRSFKALACSYKLISLIPSSNDSVVILSVSAPPRYVSISTLILSGLSKTVIYSLQTIKPNLLKLNLLGNLIVSLSSKGY